MDRKKTILIFGISSFLGSSLAEALKDKYRIIGTYFETPIDIDDVLTIKCDVHDKELVQKITFLFSPDVSIYAIGLSNLNSCREVPKLADALNTAGVFNVSSASERYNAKFIYFSSCFVFAGDDETFSESDTPMPSTTYGSTVASAEFFIQKSCLNYLILRCSPIIGRGINPYTFNWFELLERSSTLGEKLICDTKVRTGFIDIETVAKFLDIALEENITNRLIQISSSDVMNRYELSKKYFEVFGGNESVIIKGDGSFPIDRAMSLVGGSSSDQLFFRLSTVNYELISKLPSPSIEDSLKSLKSKYSGKNSKFKQKEKSSKSSDIKFI